MNEPEREKSPDGGQTLEQVYSALESAVENQQPVHLEQRTSSGETASGEFLPIIVDAGNIQGEAGGFGFSINPYSIERATAA